jgi:hypothetical protein
MPQSTVWPRAMLALPGKTSTTKICLKRGFDPDLIYDLHYMGTDPKVLGLGFASTRDPISYLRYTPQGRSLIGLELANPTAVRAAIMYGASNASNVKTFSRDLMSSSGIPFAANPWKIAGKFENDWPEMARVKPSCLVC